MSGRVWVVFLWVEGEATPRRPQVKTRYGEGAYWLALDKECDIDRSQVRRFAVCPATEVGQLLLDLPRVAIRPAPVEGLNHRQSQVLEFIGSHIERLGYAPSHKETAEELGLSRPRVSRLMDQLRARRLLSGERGRPRAVTTKTLHVVEDPT